MRILFSTPTSKQYIGCPKLSEQQVVCGPAWLNEQDESKYISINTPQGLYDLKDSVSVLPPEQQPEMIIVWADSSMTNVPCNLNKFRCPRILMVGDTHHLRRPLQNLIRYAKSEPFDYVITINNRQHAHFFVEAGVRNMYWLPGFGARIFPGNFKDQRDSRFVFIGQVGKFHPRRVRLIPALLEDKLPVAVGQLPAEKAAELYAASLGSFHCSLNGDMSFRNFEVLSSGGFLLADSLSEQSGIQLLFEAGKHWQSYDSLADLKAKMKYFLANPQAALEIARNGYSEFWRCHSPEIKRKEFFQLVLQQQINPVYDVVREKRVSYFTVDKPPVLDGQRLQIFEFVQEQHRLKEVLTVLCGETVNYRTICDLADLPRIRLFVAKEKQNEDEIFTKAGVKQAIHWGAQTNFREYKADIWILGAKQLAAVDAQELKQATVDHIIIADQVVEQQVVLEAKLKAAGFVRSEPESVIFQKLQANDEISSKVKMLEPWRQRIELPGGIITSGQQPLELRRYGLNNINFAGKRVLDVNPIDGYWTLEALKRGARQVVTLETAGTSPNKRLAFCCNLFGYTPEQCQSLALNIYDIDKENAGDFDIVLFFGKIDKLRHPLLALEKVAAICTGELYLESLLLDDYAPAQGQVIPNYAGGRTIMEFYSYSHADFGWIPTMHCLGYMVQAVGFHDVKGWKAAAVSQQLSDCRGLIRGSK